MLACQARAASLKGQSRYLVQDATHELTRSLCDVDKNLHLLLLEQFLSLLREINEQMTDFVFFKGEDDGFFDVPQLGQFDQA